MRLERTGGPGQAPRSNHFHYLVASQYTGRVRDRKQAAEDATFLRLARRPGGVRSDRLRAEGIELPLTVLHRVRAARFLAEVYPDGAGGRWFVVASR